MSAGCGPRTVRRPGPQFNGSHEQRRSAWECCGSRPKLPTTGQNQDGLGWGRPRSGEQTCRTGERLGRLDHLRQDQVQNLNLATLGPRQQVGGTTSVGGMGPLAFGGTVREAARIRTGPSGRLQTAMRCTQQPDDWQQQRKDAFDLIHYRLDRQTRKVVQIEFTPCRRVEPGRFAAAETPLDEGELGVGQDGPTWYSIH